MKLNTGSNHMYKRGDFIDLKRWSVDEWWVVTCGHDPFTISVITETTWNSHRQVEGAFRGLVYSAGFAYAYIGVWHFFEWWGY